MDIPSKHLHELYRLFLKFKTPDEIRLLLEDLFTPQEIASVAERLQIIQALVKGVPQRDIAQGLHTSIGKISRGSRVVQYGKVDWNTFFKKEK